MTNTYPNARFAEYAERGEQLLSSEGLYNAAAIERIGAATGIPKNQFAEGNPETAAFNFLAKLVQLSDQVGISSGAFYLARFGDAQYPLTDISRVATHLVNLALHPALEPLGEQGQRIVFAFAKANDSDDEAVRAVVTTVQWLRDTMRLRYQAFNVGDNGYLVREQVTNFKEHLERNYGSNGIFVGACAQHAALVLGLLQQAAESGQLDAPGDCSIKAPEGAQPADLTKTLNIALRLHFGAKCSYLDWPNEEGSATELNGPVVSDQHGVLLLWNGAVLITGLTDQAITSDGLTLQWMEASGRLREAGYEQALGYFPLV